PSQPHAILDKEQRVIGALAGQPANAQNWDQVCEEVNGVMETMSRDAYNQDSITPENSDHRRGKFLALSNGVLFGGGQKTPANLRQTLKNRTILDHALSNVSVKRIMGFQSGSFATFAPKAFKEIQTQTNLLFSHDKTLRRNTSTSVYPATTFNCGPRTVCLEHVDHGNAPNSMCAITAFGRYDPKKGGHLILVDLKLAIEVPPNSTVLILSGVIAHANTPVRSGEVRRSLTQFCAGGLLRFVAHGFRTVTSIKEEFGEKAGQAIVRAIDGEPGERWKRMLGLFSKFSELEMDRDKTFRGL
ncbi:hypothetical protein BDN72DRAFT_778616, partial [Pluteus cervinus]